jgi:hypothetical protein
MSSGHAVTVHQPYQRTVISMQATLFALGAFATLLGGSSWFAERVCRARDARTARAYLVARARS